MYGWKETLEGGTFSLGKGTGNYVLLRTDATYVIWFGSEKGCCTVGLASCLTVERSKIQGRWMKP